MKLTSNSRVTTVNPICICIYLDIRVYLHDMLHLSLWSNVRFLVGLILHTAHTAIAGGTIFCQILVLSSIVAGVLMLVYGTPKSIMRWKMNVMKEWIDVDNIWSEASGRRTDCRLVSGNFWSPQEVCWRTYIQNELKGLRRSHGLPYIPQTTKTTEFLKTHESWLNNLKSKLLCTIFL